LRLGSQVTGASRTGRFGSTKGAEVPGLGTAAAPARSRQEQTARVPYRSLREELVEALVALIEGIATQELPGPIRLAHSAQIVVVSK
jgi:hypothetical protein